MISRTHRFHGFNAVSKSFSGTSQVRGRSLSLRYKKNPRRHSFRVSVIVSKKVHKSAVKRNRMRRRIYEVIRKNEHSITQPYDLMFMVYDPRLVEISSEELFEEVQTLLKKAGITT